MGCEVTFHHRISQDRLTGAMDPQSSEAFHKLLESALAETCEAALGDQDVEIELTLSGDEEMTRLNFDHMGERGPTDVLAFPLHEWSVDMGHSHLADEDAAMPPGGLLLGDVVIDVDQAVRQAVDGGWSPAQEIALLAVHGTLHLVGHDHAESEDEAAMRAIERRVIEKLHKRHADVGWQPGSLFDRPTSSVPAGA
ncbi:MAG TPA: rRNA maturation RNase YbeY [Methylomirabilota bacterium]|jgi:probable rRNA maturation factor|nr:rRNA maturation RNase YbeY [Methylomirabilota bacterium]